jgi:hypothetical protein
VNFDLITEVHAPVFAEMERLYREALAQTATESQRRRLGLFGDYLVVLCHDLHQAGLLGAARTSIFYRDEDAYRKFLADTEFSMALYRDHRSRYTVPIWKGEYRGS